MYYKKLLRKSAACIIALAMVLTALGSVGVLSVPAYADETDSSDSGETTNTTTLTVDQSAVADGTATFNTISDAVAYATSSINPQSESERVLINVNPGDYEEQVVMENAQYITLQQDPETVTEGGSVVNLHWYYCTGYCAGDCGLDGNYDPKINWSLEETWTGYSDGDEVFTKYELGQSLSGVSTISYYDTDGVAHEDVAVQKDHLGDFNVQAALVIQSSCSNITVKDFNIVNSIPVMVTEGEKRVGVAPQEDRNADNATSYVLPHRDNLVICDEDTEPKTSSAINAAFAESSDVAIVNALEALTELTAEQSAYLVRSNKYNERGHAISINGDKIILENIRARGNQDSVYISTGRIYFKNCDLIGGTDYIYGNATAVFDNCLLGAAGMTNTNYPATITAANTDSSNPYGYLFWNCTVYNVLENITGGNVFGRPWRQDAQITFYNTKLDDTPSIGESAASISDAGWNDMSGNSASAARFYEYGTYNASDNSSVDTSDRVVNDDGFGTVLDEWQILEFNPRNYFNNDYRSDEWDPMGFGDEYLSVVDEDIENATVTVPEGTVTTAALPTPSADSVEFHWVSDSANAVVSDDDTTLTLIRPAYGEEDISATLTLYARNTDEYQYGDKNEIEITISAYTTTENSGSVAGTITLGKSYTEDKTFTLEFSESDALVKSATITVPAGTTSYDYTVENIPVGTYDIALVTDDNMKTTLSSETVTISDSTASTLNIDAYTVVDKTITYDEDVDTYVTSSSIDLLKDFSSTDIENLESSDEVTVKYTIHADIDTLNPNSQSYALGIIDLMGADPGSSESDSSNKDQRYIKTRVHSWWYQIDMIDGSLDGFDGSSNISGQQILNVAGKFDSYSGGVDYEIELVIDYANGVITENSIGTATSDGTTVGSSSFEFTTVPSNIDRGVLKLGLYNEKLLVYTLSDISVTFEEKETDDDTDATATPEPTAASSEPVTVIYHGDGTEITGGNTGSNTATFTFVSGVDEAVAALFADASDSTIIDSTIIANYVNFIGGTGSEGWPLVHPVIAVDLEPGTYTLYFVGCSNDCEFYATDDNNVVYNASSATALATSGSTTMNYYTIDLDLTEGYTGNLTFDTTAQWLPDLYAIIIDGTTSGSATDATATPAPTATAEPSTSLSLTTSDLMKSLDLTSLMTSSELSNYTNGGVVTVDYDISFVGQDVSNTQFVDIIGTSAPAETSTISDGADTTRIVRTKLNNNWVQLDMEAAERSGFGTDTNNVKSSTDENYYAMVLNLAGKFKSDSDTYTYHMNLVIDYDAGTAAVTTTKQFEYSSDDSNSGVTYSMLLGSDVSAGSGFTLVAYNNYYKSDTAITYNVNDIEVSVAAPTPSASDWTYDSDENSSVTVDEDGVYTLAYASSSGSGFSYNLTDVIENAPASISTSDGVYVIEFDLNVPTYKGDMFVDLSGSSTIYGWNPGSDGTNMYGRLAGNSSWSTVRYCGGNSATTNAGYTGASQVSGDYVHVIFTIDMSDKENITISYNGDAQTISGFASDITDELYLNIQPSASGAAIVYVKNITATYVDASDVPSFSEQETDSGRYYKDDDDETLYGVIRFLQALEEATAVDSYGFVFCDSSGKILDASTKYIANTTSETIEGFYGDIYDISSDKFNDTSGATAYAKAFVEINGEYYYSSFYSGSVTSDSKIVSDPTASTESE